MLLETIVLRSTVLSYTAELGFCLVYQYFFQNYSNLLHIEVISNGVSKCVLFFCAACCISTGGEQLQRISWLA